MSTGKAILTLAIAGGLSWYFYGGVRRLADDMERQSYLEMAKKSSDRYAMAQRMEDWPTMCAEAKASQQIWLQAGREEEYRTWTKLGEVACSIATMPR